MCLLRQFALFSRRQERAEALKAVGHHTADDVPVEDYVEEEFAQDIRKQRHEKLDLEGGLHLLQAFETDVSGWLVSVEYPVWSNP